jgi:hypothetical protein
MVPGSANKEWRADRYSGIAHSPSACNSAYNVCYYSTILTKVWLVGRQILVKVLSINFHENS